MNVLEAALCQINEYELRVTPVERTVRVAEKTININIPEHSWTSLRIIASLEKRELHQLLNLIEAFRTDNDSLVFAIQKFILFYYELNTFKTKFITSKYSALSASKRKAREWNAA